MILQVNQQEKMKSNLAMKFYKYTTHKTNYSSIIFPALLEIRCSKRLAKVRFNSGNISLFMVYKLDTCNTLFFYSGYVIVKSLFGVCFLTNNTTNGLMKT